MRKIIWETYENHLNNTLVKHRNLMKKSISVVKEDGDTSDYDEEGEDEFPPYKEDDDEDDLYKITKTIRTPIPMNVAQGINVCSNFECWLGHTNFPITYKIEKSFNEEIEGVEVFKAMTKYRFIVGIGKAFDFVNVRENIQKRLGVGVENEKNNNE